MYMHFLSALHWEAHWGKLEAAALCKPGQMPSSAVFWAACWGLSVFSSYKIYLPARLENTNILKVNRLTWLMKTALAPKIICELEKEHWTEHTVLWNFQTPFLDQQGKRTPVVQRDKNHWQGWDLWQDCSWLSHFPATGEHLTVCLGVFFNDM
jgi:hypothetical protein